MNNFLKIETYSVWAVQMTNLWQTIWAINANILLDLLHMSAFKNHFENIWCSLLMQDASSKSSCWTDHLFCIHVQVHMLALGCQWYAHLRDLAHLLFICIRGFNCLLHSVWHWNYSRQKIIADLIGLWINSRRFLLMSIHRFRADSAVNVTSSQCLKRSI